LGEGDRLTAIENVTGGRGDDVLAGDAGPNELIGGDGRDQLIGRAGNDQFDSDDEHVAPRSVDDYGDGLVSCGLGEDRVIDGVSPRDFLTPDCEQIWDNDAGEPTVLLSPTSRGARLSYTVRCPLHQTYDRDGPQRPKRCSGEIRVTRPHNRARILAHGSFPAGQRHNRDLTARLTRLGQRLTRRDRGVKAVLTLRLTARYRSGPHTRTLAWTTRLRR